MRFDEIIDQIICGDAIEIMQQIPDGCIDVVGPTSPPYWGLRDYGEETARIWGGDPDCEHEWGDEIDAKLLHKNRQNLNGGTIGNPDFREKLHGYGNAKQSFCQKCGAWFGQLGLEPHPQMYIDHLVQVFREVMRILKKSGSFWLNMGDTYCGAGIAGKDTGKAVYSPEDFRPTQFRDFDGKWLQPKQLMLIPSRLAIALQENGWILRNDIVWAKPNPMPSSVKDRLNTTWEHLFHFVKARKYYYDLDAIREKHKKSSLERRKYPLNKIGKGLNLPGGASHTKGKCTEELSMPDIGKNLGDIIKGGAILGESGAIKIPGGKGWTKKIPGGGARCMKDPRWMPPNGKNPGDIIKIGMHHGSSLTEKRATYYEGQIIDNHPLGCNPRDIFEICTQPFSGMHFAVFPLELIDKPLRATLPKDGITLDPFAGRGTVGRWCRENWGHYILIDISQKYCDMAYLYINGQKHEIDENQEKLGVIESDPKS